MLSKNISTKWPNLARLLNISPNLIENIRSNVAKYPDVPSKAVKILEIFNSDPNADMNKLNNALRDLQIRVPLRNPDTQGASAISKTSVDNSDPKSVDKTSSSGDEPETPQRM